MAITFKPAPKRVSGTGTTSSAGTGSTGKDMTQGSPFKLIFFYSIPLLIGNLVQQLYNMADTIIVGRLLGTAALAAVGTTGPMNFLVLGFVTGLTAGFAVITAQNYGAKDTVALKRSIAMNIILNVAFSVAMTVVALITTEPILRLINTPTEIFADATVYIKIIYWGIGGIVLYNGTSCILRALGDSKTPLYFLVASSVLNIVLDIVFILNFNMGVGGAAWATVISQTLAGLATLIFMIVRYPLVRTTKKDYAWDSYFAWQHLKIGLPMAFQFSITAIGVVVLQGALNIFGAVKIAGYTAAQKVEQLTVGVASTLGVTMANYTGQNLGAGDLNRIKQGTNIGTLLTISFSLVSMAIAMVFAEPLSTLFIEQGEREVIAASRQYLFITAPFYPFLFVIFIYRNVLQSLGRGFMPLMAGAFELVARTVAAYTLPAIAEYAGICFAGPLAWVGAAVPLFISYTVIIKKFRCGVPQS